MATESVEAIVAELMRTKMDPLAANKVGPLLVRLQSAHDAEMGALREAVMYQEGARSNAEVALAVAESRLREAERDASELRAAVAKTYAMIPGLPIEAETMDAATDALHDLCLTVGLFDIPVEGIDRAMEADSD